MRPIALIVAATFLVSGLRAQEEWSEDTSHIQAQLASRAAPALGSQPQRLSQTLKGKEGKEDSSKDSTSSDCGLEPDTPILSWDMHDGDTKSVRLSGSTLMIQPGDGTGSWSTSAVLEHDCTASVDFNVPNKPDPPPIDLTASVWKLSGGAGALNTAFVFNDKTGQLAAADVTLNTWLPSLNINKDPTSKCPFESGSMVFSDMGDGDSKQIMFSEQDSTVTITPHGSDAQWTTTATFDKKSCSAQVDFNVPGKPNPPPITITATLFKATLGKDSKLIMVFSDRSATLADETQPLNAWIEAM